MSQSVKLKDGSYIDASGVWDATQGKTQEEINNQCAVKFVPTGADVKSYIANRCTMWRRKGMIIINYNLVISTTLTKNNYTAIIINASDLGLTSFECMAQGNAYSADPITPAWTQIYPGFTYIQVQAASEFVGRTIYGSICIPILND